MLLLPHILQQVNRKPISSQQSPSFEHDDMAPNEEVAIEGDADVEASSSSSSPWLTGAATVRFDQQPPLLDESSRRRQDESSSPPTWRYECEVCAKSLSTAAQLTAHRWTHTKPFQCEKCLERFPAKGNLISK